MFKHIYFTILYHRTSYRAGHRPYLDSYVEGCHIFDEQEYFI